MKGGNKQSKIILREQCYRPVLYGDASNAYAGILSKKKGNIGGTRRVRQHLWKEYTDDAFVWDPSSD